MDFASAIDRNRHALIGIVATLFAMLGLVDGAIVERIPRSLRRAVLWVLRPAESAMRRLIVAAARGIKVELPPRRSTSSKSSAAKSDKKKKRNPPASFQLFDPRKSFKPRRKYAKKGPRIVNLWADPPPQPALKPAPKSDDLIDAASLLRRLNALKAALEDLPGQAMRLAKWKARHERIREKRPTIIWPLRPGAPPGQRKKPRHEVDEILLDCKWLAREAEKHDTS